jgi:hypothetical protein
MHGISKEFLGFYKNQKVKESFKIIQFPDILDFQEKEAKSGKRQVK